MYMYIYTRIYTYIHIYIYVHVCIHIHTRVCVYRQEKRTHGHLVWPRTDARTRARAWPALCLLAWPVLCRAPGPRAHAPALPLRSDCGARALPGVGGGASVPRTCVRACMYRYVYVPEPLARRKAARHGGASPAPPAPLLSLPPLRPTINPPPPRSLVLQGGGSDASLVLPASLLLLLLWALARVAEAPSGG